MPDAPRPPSSHIDVLLGVAIMNEGYDLRFADYCEDDRTPGLLGQIAGVTDRDRREVKIGVNAVRGPGALTATLAHELRHVLDPAWDCGNRDVLGRGGPG